MLTGLSLSNMQGTLGHAAWRWLFWIEGAVTMGVAISAAFILPDLPTNSKGFTEEELLVARMRMQEDVGEADTDSDTMGAFDGLKMALTDYKIYVMMFSLTAYVVGLSFNAFFVSLHHVWHMALSDSPAHSHWNPWLWIRSHPTHVLATLGLFRHCLDDQRLARRPNSGESESNSLFPGCCRKLTSLVLAYLCSHLYGSRWVHYLNGH